MGRRERIERAIKNHDPMLFCKSIEGKLCVLRKGWKWEHYALDDAFYSFLRPDDHFVFALTKDWRFKSDEVDWGIEPIINHLRECDLWHRDLVSEVEANYDKHRESTDRHRKNETEAFLKDFRRSFAKATNDINTSTLAKKDLRKIKEI